MSVEKNRKEAQRWLDTAKGDLKTAVILKNNNRFAHSCYHSQQSGEKSLKAIWYFLDADPWGHSIKKLLTDLEAVDSHVYSNLKHLEKSAIILDRFYITTRYPNGLPEITPEEAYLKEDAETCLQHAEEIINAINRKVRMVVFRTAAFDR